MSKFFWAALATILTFSTPLMAEALGASKEIIHYSFLLWFIIPGLVYGLTQKNPLLSVQTPRRYDRYSL